MLVEPCRSHQLQAGAPALAKTVPCFLSGSLARLFTWLILSLFFFVIFAGVVVVVVYDRVNNGPLLEQAFVQGRFARTRSRFAAPVILLGSTNICRSATLARSVEIKGREAHEKMSTLFYGPAANRGGAQPPLSMMEQSMANSVVNMSQDQVDEEPDSVTAKHRQYDVALLKCLRVRYICDLMVEARKIKFGLTVTSSEKVDRRGRYQEFVIAGVPYPGVELFRVFRDTEYRAERLLFDWNSPGVNAELSLPSGVGSQLSIDWTQYKSWDLVTLTGNYLRLFLHLLRTGKQDILNRDGLLVHWLVTGCDLINFQSLPHV